MANLPTKLNDKIGKQYLSKIDNYFFDCDGEYKFHHFLKFVINSFSNLFCIFISNLF